MTNQNLNKPDIPSGLTVRPGKNSLNILWNPVTNTPISSYYISVRDSNTQDLVDMKFLDRYQNSITIGNLTNGKKYDISVASVDMIGSLSSPAIVTASPSPDPDLGSLIIFGLALVGLYFLIKKY